MNGKSPKAELREALGQLNLLTSAFIALSQIVEEKHGITHEELIARVNRIHSARMRGISESEYKSLRAVADRLTIIRKQQA